MADRVDEGTPRKATTATSVSQRLKLQTNYGRALAWSRGFAAEETKAAYPRAHELSGTTSDERFDALYGRWVVSAMGGELGVAREIAETFRREAENTARMTEVAVAFRYLGLTCLMQGEFNEAEAYLVRALEVYDPERDREANLRYGVDTGAAALIYLACVKWVLGSPAQVREFIEEAVARALASGHVPTMAGIYQYKAYLESLRGDAVATLNTAETLLELGQRYELATYTALGEIYSGWARAKLGEREAGIAELQRGLTALTELGTKGGVPLLQGLLAEIEAGGQQVRRRPCPDRRSIGARGRNGRTPDRRFPASHPRRDFIEARSGEHRARRGSFPHRHRRRATTKGAELRVASGALAGEALSIDRPRRRRARRACARA